ncbi:MAG: hypothetical protein M1812_008421 [Candelaria pacifica]|nr:MAG: hypothetical protein M1812_008421 [Candelaria pacifica]
MTILVGFLICTPISRLFIKTGTGHCGSTNAAYLSISALDVVLDIVIFMLPVPSLRKLQVTSHTKVALGATFALGLFTVTAGAMRLVSVTKINFGMNMQGQLGTAYWSAIELAVGITVACLMNLRPLLDLMLTSIKQYSSKARLSTKSRQKDMNQSSAPVSGDSENADFFTRLPEIEFLPLRPNRQGHRDVAIIGLRAGSSEGPVSFLDF